MQLKRFTMVDGGIDSYLLGRFDGQTVECLDSRWIARGWDVQPPKGQRYQWISLKV